MGDRTGDQVGSVDVTFHGVRGSTPCSCRTVQRYGGNTSCVSVEAEGHDPIVFDLGTGLRPWGQSMAADDPVTIHALVSHLHWDHIQGLPFFGPLQCEHTAFHVYGPGEGDETMAETFGRFMTPPFFPIRSEHLPSTVRFHDAHHHDFEIAGTEVMARPVPHTGTTTGYRITRNDVSVAYVPDHQEPIGRPGHVDDWVLELCAGVDVLIHDAQFWSHELPMKADWGHCTPEYALEVAAQAGVRELVLFHHDPAHSDDELDEMTERITDMANVMGVPSVVCAAEGLKLSVSALG